MAAQHFSRRNGVANGPSVTFTSNSIYQYGGTEYDHNRWQYHGCRFDVVTPAPLAARSLNEACGSYQVVQAASIKLQSLLDSDPQSPDSGHVLGGQATPRQQNQDYPSSWSAYPAQTQNGGIPPHAPTGFQHVSYMPDNNNVYQPLYSSHPRSLYRQDPHSEDWAQDNIYNCRHRLSQTLEDLRHVGHAHSSARLEYYRSYDEVYYYGNVRTRLHGSKGRYGDERRHELHLPRDDLHNVTR